MCNLCSKLHEGQWGIGRTRTLEGKYQRFLLTARLHARKKQMVSMAHNYWEMDRGHHWESLTVFAIGPLLDIVNLYVSDHDWGSHVLALGGVL